jgi:predicted flap endonuclease-1-like 5' DNA nuclease
MRMSYPVLKIEGIGPKYAKKLNAIGVATTAKLLDRAKDPKGRKQLAADSDIDDGLILKWANMSDLMRIKGVGEEYSELLEVAGVDTVKELRNRKPENLHAKMVEVNAAKKLVRVLPSPNKVKSWVDQAKSLPPMMKY